MSNRDNQNKRDAGQTQQKENRENSQQNQNKAQKENPAVFLLERRAYRRMNWRFTSTLPPIPATEHLLEYCQ